MKRLMLCCALGLACFTAACSNGGSIPGAPTPTGNFSLASLKGGYAFSMSGTNVTSGNPLSRIGSFIADGSGHITAGIEDVNSVGSTGTLSFTPSPTSSYTMNANGKGTLTLVNSSGTLTFTIALSTPSFGYIVETDGSSTASGFFQLQTLGSTFGAAYAFDVTGLDLGTGASLSVIGRFTTDGSSGVTGGVEDINDDATITAQQAINAAAFGLDPNSGNGATFGRGTMTIGLSSFVFYYIDSTHLLLIEGNDQVAALVGSATAQGNIPTAAASLASSFVIDVGGGTGGTAALGPLTRVGRFTSDGTGNLTNIALDQNVAGIHLGFPKSTFSNPAITIDPTGTGRGTVKLTDVSSGAIFSYVFYLSSLTGGYIQDVSNNDIADGSISMQTGGPFTLSSLAGNYIVNWSGFNENNQFEEDFVGQYVQSTGTTSNVTGEVDYTEIGSNSIVTGAALTGALTITGDGTSGGSMANTATIQAGGQTLSFFVYIVDSNNIVLFGTDKHVVLGTATKQQ